MCIEKFATHTPNRNGSRRRFFDSRHTFIHVHLGYVGRLIHGNMALDVTVWERLVHRYLFNHLGIFILFQPISWCVLMYHLGRYAHVNVSAFVGRSFAPVFVSFNYTQIGCALASIFARSLWIYYFSDCGALHKKTPKHWFRPTFWFVSPSSYWLLSFASMDPNT